MNALARAPNLRSARVLVTGGAGFIGSHLAEALQRSGARVRVLDDLSNGSRDNLPPGVEFIQADLADETALAGALAGVDFVFHHAGLVNPVAAVEDPVRDFDTNARGTVLLLRQAIRAGVKRLLLASTNLYGDAPARERCREDHPVLDAAGSLLSPYAAGKVAAEAYCQQFNDAGCLSTVRLRYSNVYGPRQTDRQGSGVIAIFTRAALEGSPLPIYGDGTQTRDFVHVNDVVRANLLAVTSPTAGGRVFNVAAGVETTIGDLAQLVISLAGGGRVRLGPVRVADFRRGYIDIARISAQLGWRPLVGLSDGLRDYLAWLRGHLASRKTAAAAPQFVNS
jgi:UDP-glucose 4-epimerase